MNITEAEDIKERWQEYTEELRMEVCDTVQEARPSPRKTNAKRQNGCLRRPYKQL